MGGANGAQPSALAAHTERVAGNSASVSNGEGVGFRCPFLGGKRELSVGKSVAPQPHQPSAFYACEVIFHLLVPSGLFRGVTGDFANYVKYLNKFLGDISQNE